MELYENPFEVCNRRQKTFEGSLDLTQFPKLQILKIDDSNANISQEHFEEMYLEVKTPYLKSIDLDYNESVLTIESILKLLSSFGAKSSYIRVNKLKLDDQE